LTRRPGPGRSSGQLIGSSGSCSPGCGRSGVPPCCPCSPRRSCDGIANGSGAAGRGARNGSTRAAQGPMRLFAHW
jgi:hypothetical protein